MKCLSEAELYAYNYFSKNKNINLVDDVVLFKIGRAIHERLSPEPWKPEVLGKSYLFNVTRVITRVGFNEMEHQYSVRQSKTTEEAERRLRNETILNTINAWILENRDDKADNNCQIVYFTESGRWDYNPSGLKSAINSEFICKDKANKLCKLLRKGLIYGVPKNNETI